MSTIEFAEELNQPRHCFSNTGAMTAEAAERISDLHFTETYRVPFQFSRLVREHLGGDVDAMLTEHGLARSAISHWIAHTGGNRVLEAIATALDLPPGALDRSWRLLAATGNLSSASVLFVLRDLLDSRDARPGDLGVMLAMGPGFCAELALLRW